jgi:hypothetical protein
VSDRLFFNLFRVSFSEANGLYGFIHFTQLENSLRNLEILLLTFSVDSILWVPNLQLDMIIYVKWLPQMIMVFPLIENFAIADFVNADLALFIPSLLRSSCFLTTNFRRLGLLRRTCY